MATTLPVARDFRDELLRRGGEGAARCFQCATCSTVCDLASAHSMFPRRQILWAQWGLLDRLRADPAIWLCHQCNDCTARCPRDARPGDTLQAVRSILIEDAGRPRFMARLVAHSRTTWPLLLGAPILFWALFVQAVHGFSPLPQPLVYSQVVPHWMIDVVLVPAAAFAAFAALAGARRAWTAWGAPGGLPRGLLSVAGDILAHRSFEKCGAARPRRLGHMMLAWGFVGGILTTTSVAVAEYGFGMHLPMRQYNPLKILGNVSAVLLAAGAIWLLVNRLRNARAAGSSRAFDNFFLALVLLVIFSGIGAEAGRLLLPAVPAVAIYLVHLGSILALFVTFPFSKFAHALYRTLALAHDRLAPQRSSS
ncbi:MAG TPA: quinone-interacting membrane-bound oxidoreductase complex subunit QmoC [Myxococcales bacterium]